MPCRTCLRCHADLPAEDTGALAYCAHCGAPQIALSEELRERFEQQMLAAQSSASAGVDEDSPLDAIAVAANDPTAVVWSRALQLVALAAALFAALELLSLALPPVFLVTLLWLMGAPIILLGIYCGRNPATHITTSFGSRLGMLTGLSIGLAGISTTLLSSLFKRYVLHQGAVIDSQFAAQYDQMRDMFSHVTADPTVTQQALQEAVRFTTVPEFRVGGLLFGLAMGVVAYTLYTTLAGTFSGLMRSRAATS